MSKFPKFAEYFWKHLKPTLENYVNIPNRGTHYSKLWTNNNCESINHIIKMDADRKSYKTPELITLSHEITLLHFNLYCGGNYRLAGDFRRYGIKREHWQAFTEDKKNEVFDNFIRNRKNARFSNNVQKEIEQSIKSTICNSFMVPNSKLAKKPGRRTRIKATKTKVKFSR